MKMKISNPIFRILVIGLLTGLIGVGSAYLLMELIAYSAQAFKLSNNFYLILIGLNMPWLVFIYWWIPRKLSKIFS
jgi:hypothetical protein